MTEMRGLDNPPFIVVEGLDGAGTTTQCERLVERLRADDVPVLATREPSDGPIGALIRQILSGRVAVPVDEDSMRSVDGDALALLFAADRLDHVDAEIEPALASGRVVVSDRYYHSSFAYQGEGDEEEFETDWVRTLNERAVPPDLTVFLRAPARVCLKRLAVRGRRERFENAEDLERLEARYERVVQELREEGQTIETLDATRPPELVHRDLYALVRDLLERE